MDLHGNVSEVLVGAVDIFTAFREAPHIDAMETKARAVEWAREGVERGAGEILLTSMDRDGTEDGYELELTRAVADAVDHGGGHGAHARVVEVGVALGDGEQGAVGGHALP